ncbi:microtubule organization protein AKNA [Rhea pennata]|uniref:microtubule organization protein AKNA n=1 Tax=Rhea pennata TaxID=8795 RepID=UPI002E257E5F
MASSAPWLRWTERDLGSGSREPKLWEEEEEEEEDFEEHVDENRVIGLQDGLTGRLRSSRFAEALGWQVPRPPAHARGFRRCEPQEFGLEESGADGEDAGSPTSGNGEDPADGLQADLAYWRPREDATEEDEERGSSGDEERLEGTWGAESDGDAYPELSYEGQYGSERSGSPEAPQDDPALRSPYEQSLSFSTGGGETSAPSDISPSPSPRRQLRPGRREPGGASGSPGAAAGPTSPCPSGGSPGLSLPAGSGRWSLRLSADDLPGPEAEPFADSSAGSSREPPAGGLAPAGQRGSSGTPPAESPQYGRGPLNYPLPDLSKVEARVKFDQSYRPPRGRALPAAAPRGRPVLPKSPAEIVREALLSGAPGSPPWCPAPAAGLPRACGCPKQATQLVQQLQDDYHKLLTKYAEAENTIDQLRLGAKVSLYADPPKPSHSVHMGTVGTSSKVMAFSIPQARTAAISAAPAPSTALQPSVDTEPAQGPVNQGTLPQSHSPSFSGASCYVCSGECRFPGQHLCPGTQLTQTLAGQTRKFQAQVESFEAWIQAGKSTPQEQLQRFRKLKDTQDTLERAYLQAREENRRLQQDPGASGEFDPDRAVEGEIFCLGMRLEELKDQLERAAQSQFSPRSCSEPGSAGHSPVPLSETCMSSPTPSLQAPMPAARTPYPESPTQVALTSTRLGTGASSASGESEAGAELPKPFWHKQLRVEEDFGDLLEQYKHFKSLPTSLSLEQLSLAGSQSPEEVDGPVEGESGLGKISCRTQLLEERTDIGTSPLQTLERRAGPLSRREQPRPVGNSGRLPSAGKQEPLAAATTVKSPVGVPEPPQLQAPLSHRSSKTGSAASEHRLHEHCRQAKPAQAEEQRIISPEMDSGFVGSEASRVSPLMHTPEHRPPHAETPGSLGRPGPISTPSTLHPLQKREAAPLPSEKALMGIYTTSGHGPPQDGTRGPSLPPSTASQTSSPPRWADSVASEVAPDADGTHTDSEAEVEGRSCASTYSHLPGKTGGPATTMPSLAKVHHDLLGSRMERDQAIRALRDEVSRLQQRLEESLHRPRSHPAGRASPRPAKARRQMVGNGLAPKDPAPSEESSAMARGKPAPATKPARRGRSASLPRDGPELDLISESDRSPAGPWDGRSKAMLSPRRSPRSLPDTVTVKGQYTGTWYHAVPLASPAPRGEPGTPSCPHCRGSRPPASKQPSMQPLGRLSSHPKQEKRLFVCDLGGLPSSLLMELLMTSDINSLSNYRITRLEGASSSVGDAVRQPQQSTARKTRCPTCQALRDAPTPNTRDRAAHAEHSSDSMSSPGSHVAPRAEKLEQPGLWYLAASPAAASVSYLAPVPLVPYVPSVLYCSPAVSTSAPALAGLPLHHVAGYRQAERTPRATHQQAAGHHRPLTLDLDDLEDLNWSLSRAVEAAKSMKFTTKQMSRSLTSELSKVRDLRGSCLF